MGRKILRSTLVAVAVASSICLSHSAAFADTDSNVSPKTWSLAEAKAIYKEFDAQRNAICGDDRACHRNYLNEFKQQDSKYGVVEAYTRGAFLITFINPEDDIIKGIYRDFDLATYERTGRETYRDLTELYICWLDPDFEVWQFSANLRQGNEMPGLHPMVRMSATINDGAGLPFQANEEVYLPYTGTHLRDNTNQNLYFSAWMEYSNYTSNIDYSTCTASPDYSPGLGCELRFKEDGTITYLPQAIVPEKIQEDIVGLETNADPSESQEPHWEDPNEKPIHYPKEKEDELVKTEDNQVVENKASQIIPSAPETGTETIDYVPSREDPILPWWLIIIIIVGGITFMHFFGPKSSKKPRKSLDKKNRLR